MQLSLRTIILILATAASLGACAQTQSNPSVGSAGCIGGAVAGGLLGRTVGKGDGNTAATALGAVLGCAAGQSVQAAQPQPYPQQQYGGQGYPQQHQYPQQYPQQSYPQPYPSPMLARNPNPNGYAPSAFAPSCFAQWRGAATGSGPIGAEGAAAMKRVAELLRGTGAKMQSAQQAYAGAYQSWSAAREQASNPQAVLLYGNTGSQAESAERALRQALAAKADAELRYFADVARALDVCEYSAARGEDVARFADLEALMLLPMSEPHNYTDRASGRILYIPASEQFANAR